MQNKKTFVVTWQTVVEMNEVSDAVDIPWAVCEAEHRMRMLSLNPAEGDNYFTVQEVSNRPAKRHILALDEAMEAYKTEREALRREWRTEDF